MQGLGDLPERAADPVSEPVDTGSRTSAQNPGNGQPREILVDRARRGGKGDEPGNDLRKVADEVGVLAQFGNGIDEDFENDWTAATTI